MYSWTAVPDVRLEPRGPVSAAFLELGVRELQGAARWLHLLPYGRNRNRADWRLVLVERRGTCSTKHALLASLAAEQAVPLALALGLFEMTEGNTPGVGRVLAGSGLTAVPEAHCYVTHAGRRIDVTRDGPMAAGPIVFLHEETIEPAQIGEYKVALHRRFLRQWVERHDPPLALSWETVWSVREACIRALEA